MTLDKTVKYEINMSENCMVNTHVCTYYTDGTFKEQSIYHDHRDPDDDEVCMGYWKIEDGKVWFKSSDSGACIWSEDPLNKEIMELYIMEALEKELLEDNDV